MFEKERIEIESRYAFLRCLERPLNTNNFTFVQLPRLSKKKIIKSNTTSTLSTFNENQLLDESILKDDSPRRSRTYAPRTVQEYSYFDWSKVKLFKDKFKEDEIRATTNMQFLKKPIDEDLNENIFQQDQFKITESNEANQVITIRFQ